MVLARRQRRLPDLDRSGAFIGMAGLACLLFLDLASGYVQRSLGDLPKQGSRKPWRLNQNYILDVQLMRRGPLDDEGMTFQRALPTPSTQKAVA